MPQTLQSSIFCLTVFFFLLQGCGGPAPTTATLEKAPQLLSQTGLYKDIKAGTLNDGVKEFKPMYPLWTDGSAKRRWIYLPPNSKVDTSDMDAWNFPVGTKLWKEFSRDGDRIETRLLQKVGNNGIQDWIAVSYIWDKAKTDARISIEEQSNLLGSQHDVPSAAQCLSCHAGRKSVALGFSAIQLSHDGDSLNMTRLIKDKLLTKAPDKPIQVPGNDKTKAALGYLHGNCGHCHNRQNDYAFDNPTVDKDYYFQLTVASLGAAKDTDTYKSTMGVKTNWGKLLVDPANPTDSLIYKVMSERKNPGSTNGRGDDQGDVMPPLGTELVDKDALKIITEWMKQL